MDGWVYGLLVVLVAVGTLAVFRSNVLWAAWEGSCAADAEDAVQLADLTLGDPVAVEYVEENGQRTAHEIVGVDPKSTAVAESR
jgi:hypothetical protein